MTKEHVTGQENKTIQAKSKTMSKVAEKATPDLPQQVMTSGLAAVLQQTMGNQAIGRLVGRNHKPIQAKMSLNAVNDPYEQEADSVAQQVVGQLNNSVQRQENELITQRIQRQEDEDDIMTKQVSSLQSPVSNLSRQEDEDEIMTKRVQRQEEDDEIMTKSVSSPQSPVSSYESGEVATDVETCIQQAKGGGQSLADGVRQPIEQAFAADFSNVRIHTNGEADDLNQSLQARAFTTSQDIFFKEGEYSPGNAVGQELLAHELTHVVQQKHEIFRQPDPTENQVVNLPPITVIGDPNFYTKAVRSNKFYAKNPPVPGWPYDDTLRQLWHQNAFEDFADEVREIQANRLELSDKNIDGILGPITAHHLNKLLDLPGSENSENDQISTSKASPVPDKKNAENSSSLQSWLNIDIEPPDDVVLLTYYKYALYLATTIDRHRNRHQALRQNRMESNGLGSLVDFFGFTSMPDLDIWEFPLLMIGGTLSSIETTPLEIIKQELETASKLINENIEQLDKYTDRIDESGARVITILEFVSSLGQAAASRHPIGRFIYPFIQSAAERGSKVTHGVSQEFGWIDWLKEGAIDVVLEYGIDKITKPLKPILEKHLALYLDNLSPKELKEMGLTNDIFVSKGRKLIIAFLDNLGQSTLEGTVKQAIEALNGKRDLTIMEFASIVVNDALAATFIEWIKLSHSK